MVVASTTQVASVSLLSSVSAPADAVISVCGWASSHGTLGLCAFAAVHAAAVVVCFPATILFELAAGFAFGVYQGAALAWSAKVTAALITFLASSGFARTLLSNAGVEAAAERAFAAQPSLARLAQNVEQDGALHPLVHHSLRAHHMTSHLAAHLATPYHTSLSLTTASSCLVPYSRSHASQEGARYTLLARLSPIPSWLVSRRHRTRHRPRRHRTRHRPRHHGASAEPCGCSRASPRAYRAHALPERPRPGKP